MSEEETGAAAGSRTESGVDATSESHLASLVACLLLTAAYLLSALALPLGDSSRPGGGFFPAVVGAIGVLASASALAQEWRRRRDDLALGRDEASSSGVFRQAVQVAALVGVMAMYIVVAPWIGHTLASTLVLIGLLRIVRPRPWWQITLFAVAFSVCVTLLFQNVLGMRLPAGRLVSIF